MASIVSVDADLDSGSELGSGEAIKRAAREGLGVAFLSRFAVAEEVERGELHPFRVQGMTPIVRRFTLARLTGRELSPSECGFRRHAHALLRQAGRVRTGVCRPARTRQAEPQGEPWRIVLPR